MKKTLENYVKNSNIDSIGTTKKEVGLDSNSVRILRQTEGKDEGKLHGTFAAMIPPAQIIKDDVPSPTMIKDIEDLQIHRLDPRIIYQYLLAHPVIPRGIDIKTNRMVTLGGTFNRSRIEIARSKMDEDGEYWKYCRDLYYNSGGDRMIKLLIKNAHGFGAGYLLGLLNKKQTEFIKYILKHPIYFNFDKEKTKKNKDGFHKGEHDDTYIHGHEMWKIVLDNNKEPAGFREYFVNKDRHLVPDKRRKLFKPQRVVHLAFDTWGDEVEGISLMQYVHNIVLYMLNMEEDSALEVKHFGRLKYKFKTSFRSLDDVREYAQEVSKMIVNDAIVLTDGGDADLLVPKGGGPFAEYYDKFMTLLAIRLGIPKDILETTGKNSNNSVMGNLKGDMFDDISADEIIVSEVIRNQMFNNACLLKFGKDDFDYRKVSFLRFKIRQEDLDLLATIFIKNARGVQALANSLKILSDEDVQKVIDKNKVGLIVDKIINLFPEKQRMDPPGKEEDEGFDIETEERKIEEPNTREAKKSEPEK